MDDIKKLLRVKQSKHYCSSKSHRINTQNGSDQERKEEDIITVSFEDIKRQACKLMSVYLFKLDWVKGSACKDV